ncbi:uncharacterized protein LOC143378529 [Andrena cerasifolii]|uniref:uncharacterized protein LOC143378529 n=1 Tax=Andrena cerasifolii TaxID=2819439 RepID=UPI004037A357
MLDEPEEIEFQAIDVQDMDDTETQPSNQDEEVISQPGPSSHKRPAGQISRCGKKKKSDDAVMKVLETCAVALKNPTISRIEISEYEAAGIKIASQLQRIDPEQMYATTNVGSMLGRAGNTRTNISKSNCNDIQWGTQLCGHSLKSHNLFKIGPNDLSFFEKLGGLIC